ncbi:hypothetical protein TNCV_2125381 [Trichonephila clavipes]|nr:hypothetical protein TNCV_2125381 [Trichonephila clavipes]
MNIRIVNCCVVVTNATCLTKSDRGPRNSSRLRAIIFIPVVSLSFEPHAGDSTIFARFHPNIEGENHGSGQGPPTSHPLPPTIIEDLRLDGSLEYPLPQRRYTFTNIHVLAGTRTQSLQYEWARGTSVSVIHERLHIVYCEEVNLGKWLDAGDACSVEDESRNVHNDVSVAFKRRIGAQTYNILHDVLRYQKNVCQEA